MQHTLTRASFTSKGPQGGLKGARRVDGDDSVGESRLRLAPTWMGSSAPIWGHAAGGELVKKTRRDWLRPPEHAKCGSRSIWLNSPRNWTSGSESHWAHAANGHLVSGRRGHPDSQHAGGVLIQDRNLPTCLHYADLRRQRLAAPSPQPI